MKRVEWMVLVLCGAGASACQPRSITTAEPPPKAFGATVVSVSGEKQVAGVGALLEQPVVVQVKDAKGAPVAGSLVRFAGVGGIRFQPDHGLSGSDGQFSTGVALGSLAGHYQIVASTSDAAGKREEVRIEESHSATRSGWGSSSARFTAYAATIPNPLRSACRITTTSTPNRTHSQTAPL